jgi:uncharacterized protein involved in outer membrane biogenesis
MSILKKLFKTVLIFLTVYTILGFFIIPYVFKVMAEKKLASSLHRKVTIQKININPYTLSLTINGFAIKDRNGSDKFLNFDRLYINFQSLSALKGSIIIKEFAIENPYFHIIRNKDNNYNFSDLINDNNSSSKKPLRFSLNNIQFINGHIDILDNPQQKKHKIDNINISVPFISNVPYYIDTYVLPVVSANFNETPVFLKGRIKPFADSLETIFDVNLKDINMPYYMGYVPLEHNFSVIKGYLDIQASIAYSKHSHGQPTLTIGGDVSLKDMEIVDMQHNPLLKLSLLNISITSSEPLSQKYHMSKIIFQSPEVHILRDKTGEINLQTILTSSKTEEKASGNNNGNTPFSFVADEIQVVNGEVLFTDFFGSKTVDAATESVKLTAKPLDMKIRGISTEKDTRSELDFNCRLNNKGAISTQGAIGINPVFADLALSLKDIDISWLQSYFTDYVKIIVTKGAFSTTGSFSLGYSKDIGLKLKYAGQAALSDLATIDKLYADEFVKWGFLNLNDFDFGYNPFYIKIREITLSKPYIRMIVHPEGKFNLQTVFVDEKEKDVNGSEDDEEAQGLVKVDRINVRGGHIKFLDRKINPKYSAELGGIQGDISGLSSEETKKAKVLIKGKLNKYSPLHVKGEINPLREELFADLKVNFSDIDLSPMSPYSGTYVGYKLNKGKLSLDLSYLIDRNKLDSQNNVFIDQLTFGEKVKSPDALNLPVRLAASLLKNRKGEIHLNLPVTGNINDPEFSVLRVIFDMVINLLAKAATSPFTLLSDLVGGEDLSFAEFEFGSSVIDAIQINKLDALILALHERPELNLEIEGLVDPQNDRTELLQKQFDNLIKAQKLKKMLKKGLPAIPLNEIKIEPEEYETYLKMAYGDAKFTKPKNLFGLDKDAPVPDMEKLIHEHIVITDEDLRLLAHDRAYQVKDYILESKKVEPERIFILEPRLKSDIGDKNLKMSRVNFRLK